MEDQSHLDGKYFISRDVYNCPFCNRRHVTFKNLGCREFDWSNETKCAIWRVCCNSCKKVSMHLTYENLQEPNYPVGFRFGIDLDEAFFYSVPTSFFIVDRRIPQTLRKLITEAEGCVKMNHLTGASACTRKAIYELLRIKNTKGTDYNEKIKHLKKQHPEMDAELFDVMGDIKDMTSDHVHEQSWAAWDSKKLRLFLEVLKTILHEIYVVPDEKKNRTSVIRALRGEQLESKKTHADPETVRPAGDSN